MAGQTARIAVMTTMGGCSGGCTALLYSMMPTRFGGCGYPSLEYSINGVLAGMVAVCGCCAVVPIWSVFFIISPIAVASFFINMKINEKLKVDDPLGASALHYGAPPHTARRPPHSLRQYPMHGGRGRARARDWARGGEGWGRGGSHVLLPFLRAGPGIVGVIMVGFFGTDELTSNAYGYTYGEWRTHGNAADYTGVFFGGNGTQLGYQLAACAIYSVYGLITCGILFFSMKVRSLAQSLALHPSGQDELSWYARYSPKEKGDGQMEPEAPGGQNL